MAIVLEYWLGVSGSLRLQSLRTVPVSLSKTYGSSDSISRSCSIVDIRDTHFFKALSQSCLRSCPSPEPEQRHVFLPSIVQIHGVTLASYGGSFYSCSWNLNISIYLYFQNRGPNSLFNHGAEDDLPADADFVIIGAGMTGMSNPKLNPISHSCSYYAWTLCQAPRWPTN